jgi:hypothetical protein
MDSAESSTYERIKQAIERKEQVVAEYDGAPREFSPHVLGRKDGRSHVLVYQFGGHSSAGRPVRGEWRCLDVAKLRNVTTRPGPWHTAANIFNPQSCLDEIEVVVQPFPPLSRVPVDRDDQAAVEP